MQILQLRAHPVTFNHDIRIAIVIAVILQRREKLQRRHDAVRLDAQNARCLMLHHALLIAIHEIHRHLPNGFAKRF